MALVPLLNSLAASICSTRSSSSERGAALGHVVHHRHRALDHARVQRQVLGGLDGVLAYLTDLLLADGEQVEVFREAHYVVPQSSQ
jgi:hypothetical protein